MKKRVLALMLSMAMLAGVLSLAASAIPYSPSGNAWKDFGQQHLYLYEVTKGNSAPKMDGYLTDSDGYGEPIATYGFRYCTTADYVTPAIDKGEFKLRSDGTYYVYPNENSTQEVWDSIQTIETDSPYGYIWTIKVDVTSGFSPTTAYQYVDPDDLQFKNAYFVTNEKYKEGTYEVMNSKGQYKLKNYKKLAEKPEDWETNFASYYYCPEDFLPVKPNEDGTAPEFVANTYYTGDRIPAKKFYKSAEGDSTAVAQVTTLKLNHVILPEKINVYARYDSEYLYYAVEVVETNHQSSHYKANFFFGTTMSNALGVYSNTFDFAGNISKKCYGEDTEAVMTTRDNFVRTYINATTSVLDAKNILRKYGNLEATNISQVTTAGIDYDINWSKRVEKVEEKEETEDDLFGDFGDFGDTSSEEDLSSGYYGTTVYEYRLPWRVINGKYDGQETSSAVPEMFNLRAEIQLENSLAPDTYYFSFTLPRETRALPGSNLRTGGNYPKDLYMMRYADRTGLTGKDNGTYNFIWACVSSSYGNWEPFTTDYASVANRKNATASHIPFLYFTAGQEPAEGYVQPSYLGANIRADGAEDQKMRIQFVIPETEKEIKEAGVIIAPTEVARRNQLKLGLSSIAFYNEEYPVLYGVDEEGNWINMPEDASKYFADSVTPNDSDSYIAVDEYGGKPSGVYTVYTLAADLEKPYGTHKDEETSEELGTIYSVVFGGANGKGIYNDFDDFNTFYTIRPYIQYKDGTITYGEHEYKSVYYLAAWTIQEILSAYNEQANGATATAEQYNMDEMRLAALKDSAGQTMKDPQGNTLYAPLSETDAGFSCYAGGAEKSIYYAEPRLQVFRWYAVRAINRTNLTSLRVEYYDTFADDVKAMVDTYVEMYENVWNVVVQSENNRYIPADNK
ncbi:MAG: hypothetical protein IKU24_01495 [Clostridia bacterium]|nr:hypothetical protein [Clostridia bacterium]